MLDSSEVKVIQGYLERFAALTRERLKIERTMEELEAALRGILALHDEEEVQPYLEQLESNIRPEGFTEAIRRVVRVRDEALTPSEVKAALPLLAGFSTSGYSNPLASIHTILKRLEKSGEVKAVMKDGSKAYRRVSLPGEGAGTASLQRRPRHTVADLLKNPPGRLGKK